MKKRLRNIAVTVIIIINLLLLFHFITPLNINENFIPGYVIVTKTYLQKKTSKFLPEVNSLNDITFKYMEHPNIKEKRIFLMLNKNGEKIGFLLLIYKNLECASCKDALFSVCVSNNKKIRKIFLLNELEVSGRRLDEKFFLDQFENFDNNDLKNRKKYINIITGATISCKKIYEGIDETLSILDGENVNEI